LSACIRGINGYLLGWFGFFKVCTVGVLRILRTVDAHIRRRLRALLLRQWKRKRHIVRRLIRLGARPAMVRGAIYKGRRSSWALSHCPPVDHTLTTAFFAAQHLVSLGELYRRRVIVPIQTQLDLG
jgi:RNA-directed DNA polymerase